MNERIKQLAEQAGWMMGDDVEGFNTRLEKFAELIIRECADWMENTTVTDTAGNKDHIGDAYFWADKLKQHFGVE